MLDRVGPAADEDRERTGIMAQSQVQCNLVQLRHQPEPKELTLNDSEM